eukprot:scaffold26740_cov157-Cylindrotheca_fusiformis.AAC.2
MYKAGVVMITVIKASKVGSRTGSCLQYVEVLSTALNFTLVPARRLRKLTKGLICGDDDDDGENYSRDI